MKKTIILSICVLLMLSASACGGNGDEPEVTAVPVMSAAPSASAIPTATAAPEATEEPAEEADYELEYIGAELYRDIEAEQDYAIAYFWFTNLSERGISAAERLSFDAEQDGVPSSTYMWPYSSYRVLEGVRVRCGIECVLDMEGGPIRFKVTDGRDNAGTIFETEFAPGELQENIMDAWKPEPVPDPAYNASVPKSAVMEHDGLRAEVSLGAGDIYIDDGGEKWLRVSFTMENTGDIASGARDVFSLEAYQDGVSLNVFDDDREGSRSLTENTAAGEKADIAFRVRLRSDSPVIVRVVDLALSETYAGAMYKVR